MGKPAARVGDPTQHPLPPALSPGPGSPNVFIGKMPAWRGIPAAAAASLQAAKSASDAVVQAAEAATKAATGPAAPAAFAAEQTIKGQQSAQMATMISSSAGMADKHMCATPTPVPPHGVGVVIDGSATVLINGLPACRQGDTILESLGPPNKIAMGLPTVKIGDAGGSGSGGGGGGAAQRATMSTAKQVGAPFAKKCPLEH